MGGHRQSPRTRGDGASDPQGRHPREGVRRGREALPAPPRLRAPEPRVAQAGVPAAHAGDSRTHRRWASALHVLRRGQRGVRDLRAGVPRSHRPLPHVDAGVCGEPLQVAPEEAADRARPSHLLLARASRAALQRGIRGVQELDRPGESYLHGGLAPGAGRRGLRETRLTRARGATAARARARGFLAEGTAFGFGRHTHRSGFPPRLPDVADDLLSNRDLVRAKELFELARRALPFGVLLLMALSLFIVQTYREGWVTITWMAVSGAGIVAASLFSISSLERRASRAFRQRDYPKAAELYEQLAEEKPLARNQAFLGAALGASERYEESVNASTKAIEDDPEYGIAYYNRALVRRRQGKTSLAVKDLRRALEVDLPRRFRTSVRTMLEELS